ARFVKAERDGKFIYYSVNYRRLQELNKFVQELLA
ncbi:MAG: transcriptional regulator, partial [Chitinophagaceae bacterium]